MSTNLKVWLFTLVVVAVPVLAYFAYNAVSDAYVDLPVYGPVQEDGSAHRIPDFQFINQDSAQVGREKLDGKITVANYFFTSCPSICPAMIRNMKMVQEYYSNKEDIQFMSFTVDPIRDQPLKFRSYIEKHALNTDRWDFLTGDKKELYWLARQGFMLTATDGDGGPADFIHSENLVLLDGEGKIRGFYDGTDDAHVNQLMKDIKKLQKQGV